MFKRSAHGKLASPESAHTSGTWRVLLKAICSISAVSIAFLLGSIQTSHAEGLDMKTVFSTVTEAGLIDPFYEMTSVEPPPSGYAILEGLIVGDDVKYQHVGGDGAGGAFITLEDGTLIYVSSEGQATGLADSVEQFLSISLSMYEWFEALKFIRGDFENDMNDWEDFLRFWGMPEKPKFEEEATKILNLLGLTASSEPFSELHRVVSSTSSGLVVRNQHGEFEGFGKYR